MSCRFKGISELTGCKSFILRMVKKKIFDLQICGQAAGIERGTVVFFVGFEALAIRIKAKGLAQQPISPLRVASGSLIEWLIPKAYQS